MRRIVVGELQTGRAVPPSRGKRRAGLLSRAGNLSDPNIDPEFLAHLVMVSVNKKAFQPSIEAIKNKYYELYRGKGGAGEGDEGDEGAADGDAEVREGEAGPSSAGQK